MKFYYTLFVTLLILVVACKKETVTAPYPYNEITAFAVAQSSGDSLQAAVTDGKIILYWPSSVTLPDSVTPVIRVSERATVLPASGQKIALKDSVVYTVTSESGVKTTYKLQLTVNQPSVVINENSDVITSQGGTLSLGGLYNVITDTSKTRIYLISKAGVSTRLAVSEVAQDGSYGNIIVSAIPDGLDTGWYKIKITSGISDVSSTRAYVYVGPGVPVLLATPAFTLKRGDTYTLPGKNLHDIQYIIARNADDDNDYSLEIVSNTTSGVTVRVPDDFPLGLYSRLVMGYITYTGDYDSYFLTQQMTITE